MNESILTRVAKFFKGKKTYILIIATLLLIGYIGFTGATFETIPAWVWTLVTGLGFGAVRDAVNSASKFDNKGVVTYFFSTVLVIAGLLQLFGIEVPNELIVALDCGGAYGLRRALNKMKEM